MSNMVTGKPNKVFAKKMAQSDFKSTVNFVFGVLIFMFLLRLLVLDSSSFILKIHKVISGVFSGFQYVLVLISAFAISLMIFVCLIWGVFWLRDFVCEKVDEQVTIDNFRDMYALATIICYAVLVVGLLVIIV